MNWTKAGKYHLLSDKGYKVAKFKVGDDWKYRAFTPKDDFDYQTIGTVFNSGKEAYEACEEYENANNR